MAITAEELIKYAERLEDTTLYTLARRQPFSVESYLDSLVITPLDTIEQIPRSESAATIAKVLERLEATGSTHPGDYADITYNGSYVLALIVRYRATEIGIS